MLAQYPHGLVLEAVDPRVGLARKVEFLSVHKVVEWCDARLAYHHQLASYRARPKEPEKYAPDREFTDQERETARAFMADLAKELAAKLTRRPQYQEAAE